MATITDKFNRRYWLHRITINRVAKEILLEDIGLMFTSWNTVASGRFLDSIKNVNKSKFTDIYAKTLSDSGIDNGENHKNRFCLFMFLNEFKKGDYIIVPGTKNFSVYEIVGEQPYSKERLKDYKLSDRFQKDYEFRENDCYSKSTGEKLDFGFFWQVKLVEKDISRTEFCSNNINRRLKYQMTNIEMTNLKDDIEESISRKRENNPLDLLSEIKDAVVPSILKRLKETIEHRGFEKIVCQYLESIGGCATILSTNNLPADKGDVDIEAWFEDLQVKVLVQVKQHDKDVDVNAVKQIIKGSENYDGNIILWVVSTCEYFTDEARRMADQNNVRLIDGIEFASMLLSQFGNLKPQDKQRKI